MYNMVEILFSISILNLNSHLIKVFAYQYYKNKDEGTESNPISVHKACGRLLINNFNRYIEFKISISCRNSSKRLDLQKNRHVNSIYEYESFYPLNLPVIDACNKGFCLCEKMK